MAETGDMTNQRDTEHHKHLKADATPKRNSITPWEQHSSVIIIPRYNYKAPSSLLQNSHSGFLITCPIKREKSATKEAMSILEKFVGPSNYVSSDPAKSSDELEGAKRRKISLVENNGNSANVLEDNSSKDDDEPSQASTHPGKEEPNIEHGLVLSLVKLTRSGLLLFTFPEESYPDTVNTVSSILQSLESKNLKTPLWCHRIFPIQATCSLNEKDLHNVVTRLVQQFVSDKRNILSQPLKFAVGYNRRGIEETEMKTLKHPSSDDASLLDLLDRNKCFTVVASAVKGAVSDSVVDLKHPEITYSASLGFEGEVLKNCA